MPLVNSEQRSPEWFAARQGKITASLAAACLGFDPYISRQKAYRSIMGERTPSNKHMDWGVEFEKAGRSAYECETGNLVEETGLWVSSTRPWLAASPDGLVGTDTVLEIKVPSKHPAKIPVNHRIQMIVQMFCTNRLWCDYCTYCNPGDGWTIRITRIIRPPTSGLIAKLEKFYQKYVVTQTEPERKKRRSK